MEIENKFDDIRRFEALQKLKKAFEYNNLEDYLMGYPPFSILVNDGGYVVDSYQYPIRAIYDLYFENQDMNLVNNYFSELVKLCDNVKSTKAIYRLCMMCDYIITYQKNSNVPFHFDCEKLLDHLKNNIFKNKEMFLKDNEYWNALEDYADTFEKRTGNKIL